MKQLEIQDLLCTVKHGFGGSHFLAGEKKCRTCNIFYKTGFEGRFCVKCGKQLGVKSHKKHSRPSRYGY